MKQGFMTKHILQCLHHACRHHLVLGLDRFLQRLCVHVSLFLFGNALELNLRFVHNGLLDGFHLVGQFRKLLHNRMGCFINERVIGFPNERQNVGIFIPILEEVLHLLHVIFLLVAQMIIRHLNQLAIWIRVLFQAFHILVDAIQQSLDFIHTDALLNRIGNLLNQLYEHFIHIVEVQRRVFIVKFNGLYTL